MNGILTYEIWRAQDFLDLDERDIIYRKINTISLKLFKEDGHVSYEEAKKEADRYIEFISSVYGPIAPYLDKLYIIKNSDNINKYSGDEYYNMRYLLRNHKKIRRYNENIYKLCGSILLFCFVAYGLIVTVF